MPTAGPSRRNDFRFNARDNSSQDSLDIGNLAGGATVTQNFFYQSNGGGFDSYRSDGGNTIRDNTFDGNGVGATEDSAIRLFGTGNTVATNVIRNSVGPGVLVVANDAAVPNAASTGNLITRNSFTTNGLNSIDLAVSSAANSVGDGATANDGATNVNAGNIGLDYPVITNAYVLSGVTYITGTAPTGATRVEVYRSVAGVGDGGGAGFGEGVQYLGTASVSAGGTWTLAVTGLVAGNTVSAIAFDAANNTSEFGLNVTVSAAAPTNVIVVDTTADYNSASGNWGTVTSIAALAAAKGADGRVSLREALTAANAAGHQRVRSTSSSTSRMRWSAVRTPSPSPRARSRR